jgi:hypothetical protein
MVLVQHDFICRLDASENELTNEDSCRPPLAGKKRVRYAADANPVPQRNSTLLSLGNCIVEKLVVVLDHSAHRLTGQDALYLQDGATASTQISPQ